MLRITRPSKKTTGLRSQCVLRPKLEPCTNFGGEWHIEGPFQGGQNFVRGKKVPRGECLSKYGEGNMPF